MGSLWKVPSRAATPHLLLPLSDLTPSTGYSGQSLEPRNRFGNCLCSFLSARGEVLGSN